MPTQSGSRREFLRAHTAIAFAHRGGSSLFPENTLVSFQGALDLGIEYLETDLHLTRDGHIVVFHDHEVDRTTDGSGPIGDLTLAEAKRLDAGYRFTPDGGRSYPHRDRGVRIPTLDELLALGDGFRLNVEIKQRGHALVEALWHVIDSRGLWDRFLVAAAHDPLVVAFREVSAGRVATAAGMRECLKFWGAVRSGTWRWVAAPYDALQVPPSFPLGGERGPHLTVIEPAFMRAAHARGVEVHVWTIDRPHEMRRLLSLGVDGLMSDRPDYLVQVLPPGGPQPGLGGAQP